jgi:stage V sporulation protein S
MRVSSGTATRRLAGAIAGVVRDNKVVILECIGPAAISQAVKAWIAANLYLTQDGLNCYIVGGEFFEIDIEGARRTGIRLFITEEYWLGPSQDVDPTEWPEEDRDD